MSSSSPTRVDNAVKMQRFWVAVASKDHVSRGIHGGFAQTCHGKCAPLKRTKEGDGIVYYSSKVKFEDSTSNCKKFTAIGYVKKSEPYQVSINEDFKPYRIDVEFEPNAKDVSWETLKSKLSFASKLRFGFAEISKEEFSFIREHML